MARGSLVRHHFVFPKFNISDQKLQVIEVTKFLDQRASSKGYKNSQDKVMVFVNDIFKDLERENQLTVIEFFCALPKFEKVLQDLDDNDAA